MTNAGPIRSLTAAVAVATLGCLAQQTTKIGDIFAQPKQYDGRTVTVAGSVLDATNLFVLKYYRVEDSTGRIVVIARGAVPAKGTSVKVRGVVHQAFAVGSEQLTVIVEEPAQP
jgi:hypothetical protein